MTSLQEPLSRSGSIVSTRSHLDGIFRFCQNLSLPVSGTPRLPRSEFSPARSAMRLCTAFCRGLVLLLLSLSTAAAQEGRARVDVPESNWKPINFQGETQNHILDGIDAVPSPPARLAPDPALQQQVWPDGEPVQPPNLPEVPDSPFGEIPDYLQFRHDLAATWSAGSGDGLGIVDFDYRAVPSARPKRAFAVGVTPGFGAHIFDGPNNVELPGTVYDVSFDVQGMYAMNARWRMLFGISPSWYTDFSNKGSDAFRLPSRLLTLWQARDDLQVAFGVAYLDREDIKWLPAAGLIYTPNEAAKLELMFPRPRILRRVKVVGDVEGWAYLGGEFGGGSYAIRRSNGYGDVVTYSALRLMAGYERLDKKEKTSQRIEAGYVFNRSLRYLSGVGDYNPDSTAMIRVGWGF